MGIKDIENRTGNNCGFGNLVSLRPLNENNNNNINKKKSNTITSINKNKIPKTRVISISEELHKRFVSHSRRFYNVETYDQILNNLLNYCEENHKETFWYNRDR